MQNVEEILSQIQSIGSKMETLNNGVSKISNICLDLMDKHQKNLPISMCQKQQRRNNDVSRATFENKGNNGRGR